MNKILFASLLLLASCTSYGKRTVYQVELIDGTTKTITCNMIEIVTINDIVDGEVVHFIDEAKQIKTSYDATKIKSISKIKTISIYKDEN